jgi:ubiquinone/menaquinone biosynthesis C-methylase UbiE
MVTKTKQGKKESGRRQIEGYGLMNDAQEAARLALEHHLYKLAWRKNYLAPLQAPKRILDVACGSGIWGYEVLQEWPQAQIINLDNDDVLFKKLLVELLREKKIRPQECGVFQPDGRSCPTEPQFLFTKVDARQRLPFADEIFDFTHSRSPEFLSEEQWPWFIRELARITKSEGFVEIVSYGRYYTGQPSEAATRLFDAGMRLGECIGVTLGGVNFSQHLQRAGVPGEAQLVILGKGKRQQELLIQDILHAEHQVKQGIIGFGIMTQEEVEQLIKAFERDARTFGLYHPSYRVCFQPKDIIPA